MQNLLQVHDAVAQKDFEPSLAPVPDDALDEEEDSVKIVSLVKTKEPLVSSYFLNSIQVYFFEEDRSPVIGFCTHEHHKDFFPRQDFKKIPGWMFSVGCKVELVHF